MAQSSVKMFKVFFLVGGATLPISNKDLGVLICFRDYEIIKY